MSWFKNRVEVPGEVIYEVVTADDNAGFGFAVAEIEKSKPHFHLKTRETYKLVSGALLVHVGNEKYTLNIPGQTVVIPLNVTHWAEKIGDEIPRVAVFTVPAWTPEDHILV